MANPQEYYGASTAIEPRRQTPFDAMERLNDRASLLADRIGALATNLVGPVPTDATKAMPPSSSGGLLGELATRAAATADRVDAALDALNRIERALP